jgi:hypothetical protein
MSDGQNLNHVGVPDKKDGTDVFFDIYLGSSDKEQYQKQDDIQSESKYTICASNVYIFDGYF